MTMVVTTGDDDDDGGGGVGGWWCDGGLFDISNKTYIFLHHFLMAGLSCSRLWLVLLTYLLQYWLTSRGNNLMNVTDELSPSDINHCGVVYIWRCYHIAKISSSISSFNEQSINNVCTVLSWSSDGYYWLISTTSLICILNPFLWYIINYGR